MPNQTESKGGAKPKRSTQHTDI